MSVVLLVHDLSQGGGGGLTVEQGQLDTLCIYFLISGFISTGAGSRVHRSLTGVEIKSLYYHKTSRVYILAVDKTS